MRLVLISLLISITNNHVNGQKKQPDPTCTSFNNLAAQYDNKARYDSAIHHYQSAFDCFLSHGDSTYAALVLINRAKVYRDLGRYLNGMDDLVKAQTLLSKPYNQTDHLLLYSSTLTLATIYRKTEAFDVALDYNFSLLDIIEKMPYGQEAKQARVYNNIANLYIDLQRYDEALDYLERSLEVKRKLGDERGIAIIYHNQGVVHKETGKLRLARQLLNKSLAIKRTLEDKKGIAQTLYVIAELYIMQGRIDQAEPWINEASELAIETESLDLRKRILYNQIELAGLKNNFKEAHEFAMELIEVNDEILNKNTLNKIGRLERAFDNSEKNKQISELRNEVALHEVTLEKRWQMIAGLSIIIFLVFVIALLLFNRYRSTKSNERRIELLLEELRHRMKNNLQILSSVLSLQSQQLSDKDAKAAVKSGESRVNAMAIIHKKLFLEGAQREIDIKEYINELVESLTYSYIEAGKSIDLDIDVASLKIDVDRAIPLGLIINELVSNAFKYAFPETSQPKLAIKLEQQDETHLNLVVADNGPGLNEEHATNKAGSFGLKMVKMLVGELRGKSNFNSKKGTAYSITFPQL
ncbi:MAG: tetratricopeptide repeat protein [Bacteroidota bacterium]